MKNYNKILEAINRGIKFALDDFDNNEEIQSLSNSKVKYLGGTKEWLDLMNEVVDLGLPSGTLWCKYNLDANPKLLLTPEDWYGKYYAWGELEGNKTKKNEIYFKWSNYKFGNFYNKLIKYCNNFEYGLNGFADNLTQLKPEDDVAYQFKKCHNYKFYIPTKEQCEELIKYTNNYWVYNYDPNKIKHNPEDDKGIQGLNGRVFEGKNENQLFIPAAGYCRGDSDICCVGSYSFLWSSNLDSVTSNCAYVLSFDLDIIKINFFLRYEGLSVRPVCKLN